MELNVVKGDVVWLLVKRGGKTIKASFLNIEDERIFKVKEEFKKLYELFDDDIEKIERVPSTFAKQIKIFSVSLSGNCSSKFC